MTALDRAFIKAYRPQEARGQRDLPSPQDPAVLSAASGSGSAMLPSAVSFAANRASSTASATSQGTHKRNSVMAALEQPIQAPRAAGPGSQRDSATHLDFHPRHIPSNATPAGSAMDEGLPFEKADIDNARFPNGYPNIVPMPNDNTAASQSPFALSETETIHPQQPKPPAMHFGDYSHGVQSSHVPNTTLSEYMRLRDEELRRNEAESLSNNSPLSDTQSSDPVYQTPPQTKVSGLYNPITPDSSSQNWNSQPSAATSAVMGESGVDITSPFMAPAESQPLSTFTASTSSALGTAWPAGQPQAASRPIAVPTESEDSRPRTMPEIPLPEDLLPSFSDNSVEAEPKAWQVQQIEQFAWPQVCRRLMAKASGELELLVDALLEAVQRGQRVLAISGWHRAEGATTLLLCAARRLAERGVKPVLIDADLDRPRLAKRLGVTAEMGWENLPDVSALDHVMVEAAATNIALAPACEPSFDSDITDLNNAHLENCLAALQQQYDIVLVDLGPLERVNIPLGSSTGGSFQGVDAVVLVRDQRLTSQAQLHQIHEQMTAGGAVIIGIVENFAEA
jgi:Mrp family chromosome partitioning ATPase